MKKFRVFTIVLGALVMASMVSCTKDGVYNPKKKIQRTYYSSPYTNKYMATSWNWDGNLLESINYYNSSGSLSWTENYTYDGKRLIQVDDYMDSEYTTYEYDGKNLKTANYYRNNALKVTAAYTYADGKLSKVILTGYGSKSKEESLLNSSFLPFPKEVTEALDKGMTKAMANNTAKIVTATLSLTWSGNNVSKILGTEEGDIVTMTFQYDDKTNPLKGYLNLYNFILLEDDGLEEGNLNFSENNITNMMWSYLDGENEIVKFTYQYDNDGWPTMRIRQYDDDSESQYIDYYEYK